MKRHWHCWLLSAVVAFASPFALGAQEAPAHTQAPVAGASVKVNSSTADHSKFKELEGPFLNGSEVTRACLSCHTEAAKQIMATKHWSWEYKDPQSGKVLGKKTMLNNFCIGDRSNEGFCQSCHVGYGWKDSSFDFSAQEKVDCLVCHHTGVGNYKKPPGLAGEVPTQRTEFPPGSGKYFDAVDLALVAQHIGKTSTQTCGTCHYRGGGGDGVKHGDLDSSLDTADRSLDVHMASKAKGGAGFTCATCHESDGHHISGSRIQMAASDPHGPRLRGSDDGRSASTCQSCHGSKPHKSDFLQINRLNQHSDKLACQACHVPAFARGGIATKTAWDWSTAGKMNEKGKPYELKDSKGNVIYSSKKGDFVLEENVVPDYIWFNGNVEFTTQEDIIDPTEVVQINTFMGSFDDPASRIWPVKIMQGKQPYDTVHNRLLVPHTATPDDTGFWFNFDWDKSLVAGAQATGIPFSGQYDFVNTEMIWPITHMVAPSTQAVSCVQCHTSADKSRMGQLTGIYVPGRDRVQWMDELGWLAVALALLGVLGHASLRIIAARRRASRSKDGG
jgi:octaheme c-type cytochrome (tetrathionate reductase family)